ncbi:MAG: N-6 DNA methylase, partial [Candidatus Brocadiaceae bacterium]|nr:N-6 DNA methylase [Candidatus Brocadiaceae bacterium]
MDTSTVRENIKSLVEKFERDKHHYLSKDYLEAQTRKDFIDPLFEALGWDISNKAGLPPFEREVLLEKGETSGRPDYNFRLGGVSKFFVEAKAPPESLDSVRHVLQAKSYAWNTKEVFIVVLTDFEGLKVFDASLSPDKKNPLQGLILDLKYTEYLNNLDKLLLLSKEAVSQGSLERLLLKDAKSKRQRIPVDKKFLQDMGLWREGLAKDVYRHDPSIGVRTLNEVVQRLLDRVVFIRIAEDRRIRDPRTLFEIAQLWKAEGKKRPIQYHLNNLFREINADLNGDIFKSPHACEQYEIDSALLAEIIEDLYFPNSPYLFDVIGVELLGSIYERYLGSTIRVTAGGRVKVEEKPEVRKAGGVYYTPQYIVKYIVENTVGKLVEGKTPKQIEKIKVLDPACGSGSFLLGAYQYLIDYHIKYYREHPKEAHVHPLFPDLISDSEGKYRLSIIKKGHILRNNLFGVDIDPQAVEITMMSLYLKALEGERTLPRKQGLLPVLSDNIKCGNSLISYDIFEPCRGTLQRAPTKGQGILVGAGLSRPDVTDEERERINPFDWDSRQAGFGEIMGRGGFDCVIGNPPYGASFFETEKPYFQNNYQVFQDARDVYACFIEAGFKKLKINGLCSFIVPSAWLGAPK